MKVKSFFIASLAFLGFVTFAGPVQAAHGYSVGFVNLRSGPDRGYPIVAQIPASAVVNIEGCVDGWGWCDVSWRGYRGWMSGKYLQTNYQNRHEYIYDAGPSISVIIQFSFGSYWDNHYRNRSFYRDRDRYAHMHDGNWQDHDHDRHDSNHNNNGHHWNN